MWSSSSWKISSQPPVRAGVAVLLDQQDSLLPLPLHLVERLLNSELLASDVADLDNLVHVLLQL
jgi:hypothetical protein